MHHSPNVNEFADSGWCPKQMARIAQQCKSKTQQMLSNPQDKAFYSSMYEHRVRDLSQRLKISSIHNIHNDENITISSNTANKINTLPCKRCSNITFNRDIQIFNSFLFTHTVYTDYIKAMQIAGHIERCIHCALHYAIIKYNDCKTKCQYYRILSRNNVILINPLLLKKLINKFKFFSIYFEATVDLIVNKYSAHEYARQYAIGNLQDIFCMLKSGNVKFVLKSENNINIFNGLMDLYCYNHIQSNFTDHKYGGFINVWYLVRAAIIKHANSINKLINEKMISSHKEKCINLIDELKAQPFEKQINLLICRRKLKMKNHICCGNVNCNRMYLDNKFIGRDIKQLRKNTRYIQGK
eukprot:352555_1